MLDKLETTILATKSFLPLFFALSCCRLWPWPLSLHSYVTSEAVTHPEVHFILLKWYFHLCLMLHLTKYLLKVYEKWICCLHKHQPFIIWWAVSNLKCFIEMILKYGVSSSADHTDDMQTFGQIIWIHNDMKLTVSFGWSILQCCVADSGSGAANSSVSLMCRSLLWILYGENPEPELESQAASNFLFHCCTWMIKRKPNSATESYSV